MLDHDKTKPADYTALAYMRTDELKEILKKDSQQPGNVADAEKILYILEVLEKREAEKNPQRTDLDAEWEVFQREYLPLAEKGIALYEEEPDTRELDDAKTVSLPRKKRRKNLMRSARVAAAVIAIVLVGSLTAQAAGIQIWDAVMTWTQETFGFQVQGQREEVVHEIPEQCRELNEALMQYGAGGIGVIPTYIPEGYQAVQMESEVTADDAIYVLLLSDGEHNMILQYCLYFDGFSASEYQKNNGSPEVYEVGGVTHYIAQNMDTFVAVWHNGNLEGSLSGVSSYKELIKIIDSIYDEV